MYDTVNAALLTTILTEWFPGGLTSLFSTSGRVPVNVLYQNCLYGKTCSHMDGEVPH